MTDHHPVPAQLYTVPRRDLEARTPRPDHARVEFVLFGYTKPDGAVIVTGSRAVDQAEIRYHYDDHVLQSIGQTITVQTRSVVVGYGHDMRSALANLLECW